MTEDFLDDSNSDEEPSGPPPQSQEIRHNQISALVPEHVAKGTFSTGAVVLHGQHEFIIDFLLRMQQPQQVAARIVLPPTVVAQFIQALKENLKKVQRSLRRTGAAKRAATCTAASGSRARGDRRRYFSGSRRTRHRTSRWIFSTGRATQCPGTVRSTETT